MSVELEIVGEEERDKWDTLVDRSPHGNIFHTWKWLKIMEKHSGSKLYPVIGLNGTTPIGVYPLFYQKKFLVKTVFSPPPQLAIPYLGPALVDYDKLKQDKKELIFIEFQKQVDDFVCSELKPNYVSIYSSPSLLDSRPFKWTGYQVEPMYSYLIDLSKGADYVWKQFKSELRKNIIKAEEKEVDIENSSKEVLEIIYDSLFSRYEEQGRVLPLSKGYLLDVYDSFHPQNMHIFVAKYQDEFIAGAIKLHYKNMLISWIGHAKTSLRGTPNDLLQWHVIKWACEQDLKYYDLIGANISIICHYKSKYNPNISMYYSLKKYSSFITKMMETAYPQILKPIYAKFKMKTKWVRDT